MATFSDLSSKINDLFGYTPSQAQLLARPDLMEIAFNAIAANCVGLVQIAQILNPIIGRIMESSELLARPDLIGLGLLALRSNAVPVISLSDLDQVLIIFNQFMGSNYTTSNLTANPDLLKNALLVFENSEIPFKTTTVIDQGYWLRMIPYIFAARQPLVIPSELMAIAPATRTSNVLIEGDRWRDTDSSTEYVFDGRGWCGNDVINLIVSSKIRAKVL